MIIPLNCTTCAHIGYCVDVDKDKAVSAECLNPASRFHGCGVGAEDWCKEWEEVEDG